MGLGFVWGQRCDALARGTKTSRNQTPGRIKRVRRGGGKLAYSKMLNAKLGVARPRLARVLLPVQIPSNGVEPNDNQAKR
jgi:hypothetical protein